MMKLVSFRRLPLGITCLALALFLGACGGPKVPLAGVVKDAYTGEPVASAAVKMGNATATTDAAGKYQMTGWDTKGTLEVSANWL